MARNRYRPHHDKFHRGVPSEDIEAMTGRPALDHIGAIRGEVVYIRAMVVDGVVCPGHENEVKVELLQPDGYSLGEPLMLAIDYKHVIKAESIGDYS